MNNLQNKAGFTLVELIVVIAVLAILAGVGAGVYPSVPEACDAVIRTKTEQPAIPENSAAYEPYYQLYHNTYAAIKPICHALGEME